MTAYIRLWPHNRTTVVTASGVIAIATEWQTSLYEVWFLFIVLPWKQSFPSYSLWTRLMGEEEDMEEEEVDTLGEPLQGYVGGYN